MTNDEKINVNPKTKEKPSILVHEISPTYSGKESSTSWCEPAGTSAIEERLNHLITTNDDSDGCEELFMLVGLSSSSSSTQHQRYYPSVLMQLISLHNDNDDDWEPAYQRIHSHPDEIAPPGHQTALHTACLRRPPTRIIQAIVDVEPDAILLQNRIGETPLHLAAYTTSDEVQSMMIRARPQVASIRDQNGDLPIHFASRNGASASLMKDLLKAAPKTVSTPNKRGETPLSLLPTSYFEADCMDVVLQEHSDKDYYDDWQLLVLCLRFAYFGKDAVRMSHEEIQDYESWVVHAAASTPSCPRGVLQFLCRIFPKASLKYNKGRTPLILALRAPETRESTKVSNEDFDNGNDTVVKEGANAPAEEATTSVVDMLLDWSPSSALLPDEDGRLPLAHALVAGKTSKTIRSLVAVGPRAIESIDPRTGLYMFQLASQHTHEFDSLYFVLRSWPEVVARLAIQARPTKLNHLRNNEAVEEPVSKRKRLDH